MKQICQSEHINHTSDTAHVRTDSAHAFHQKVAVPLSNDVALRVALS